MKSYTIPFSYTVNGTIKIDANSLDSALSKAYGLCAPSLDGSCKLLKSPMEGGVSHLVDNIKVDADSIKIDHEEAEELNPKKSYTVKLVRTQTVEVEVEAHSAEEAERTAIEGAEDGSLDDFSNCIDEEIVAEEIEEIED
jgi:hypothetical protein